MHAFWHSGATRTNGCLERALEGKLVAVDGLLGAIGDGRPALH